MEGQDMKAADLFHWGPQTKHVGKVRAALLDPGLRMLAVEHLTKPCLPPAPWELPCDVCEPGEPCEYHR